MRATSVLHARPSPSWPLLLGLILGLATAAAILASPVPSLLAAGVDQPISVTVAGGGPVGVGTLSGCDVTPSTISFDGLTHVVSADPGCAVTLSVPADGAVSRYRFGTLSDVLIKTCGGGYCSAVNETAYAEFSNTYKAIETGAFRFVGTLVVPVRGEVGTLGNSVICSAQILPNESSDACSGWTDYGTTAMMPGKAMPQLPGVRWEGGGTLNFTDVNGGNVHSVSYYRQEREYFSFVVPSPRGAGYSAPVLSYWSLGTRLNFTVTGRGSLKWVDTGSAWSMTNPLTGSGASERWYANLGSVGTILSPGRVRPTYFHQYQETFKFSVSDASSPQGPLVSYRVKGSAATLTATTVGLQTWVDAGTLARYVGVLNDSTSAYRWATPRLDYRVSGSGTINDTYFHQYLMTLGYTTSDSTTIASGSVLGSYFAYGNAAHSIVSNGTGGVAPGKAWVDAGTNRIQFDDAVSPTGGERWALQTQPDLRNATASATVLETGYLHQYGLEFSYALIGGGDPAPPSMACVSLRSPFMANLTATVRTYFCDAGQTWSVSNSLLSSMGLTDRWEMPSRVSPSGPVNETLARTFQYQHQVLMIFEYAVVGGGTPVGPSVVYFQFGTAQGVTATNSGVSVWADVGSTYTYSNPSSDSTGSERWASKPTANGPVSSASTIDPSYYHQYLDTLQYTVSGGGSPAPPLVSFSQFGSADSQLASTGTSSQAWIDAGTTVTYPASITDGTSTWTTSTTTFTAALLATFDPTYAP